MSVVPDRSAESGGHSMLTQPAGAWERAVPGTGTPARNADLTAGPIVAANALAFLGMEPPARRPTTRAEVEARR